jgi:hypothetical protein
MTPIASDQKTVLKGELLIWRTNNEARDQGMVQLKDSICFKSVEIGPWTLFQSGPQVCISWELHRTFCTL